ncbi:MAG: Kelch repeat-containing protein, partial [Candidatus Eiseniibacteriota bacterium]
LSQSEIERHGPRDPKRAVVADGAWRRVPTLGRTGHTAVYDPVGDRMIAFGGVDEDGRYLNDVWTLSLAGEPTWTLLVPDGAPPAPRAGQGSIYDPMRNRMVITAGSDGAGLLEDTWALSLTGTPTWSEMATVGEPFGLAGMPAVYDPVGDRLAIVIVSFRSNRIKWLTLGDSPTWSLVPAAGGPGAFPQLTGHTATYDAARGRVIIRGGEFDEVWAITLNDAPEWTQILPEGVPPSVRSWSTAFYDDARDRLVLFGGEAGYTDFFNDVWALSFGGTPRWDEIVPGGAPPRWRYSHGAIYDPTRDRMTVLGGSVFNCQTSFDADCRGPHCPSCSDTWLLSFAGAPEWTELSEFGRLRSTAIYDPLGDRMALFGGLSGSAPRGDAVGGSLGGTSEWKSIAGTGSGAPARFGHSATYDATSTRMVVFAGHDGGSPRNDLWALFLGSGGAAWSELFPSSAPPPARFDHSAIHDPLRNRLIAFGGTDGSVTGSDTWALGLGPSPAWTLLPAGGAPARAGHSAIYDASRDRMLVFGGSNGAALSSDLWALPLGGSPAWSLLPVSGPPPSPRRDHSAVYDPVRDRMLVFGGMGGSGGSSELNDCWALELGSSTPTWLPLAPAGAPPGTRAAHVALFDPLRDRMLIFGGADRDSVRGDLWSLDLGAPTSALVSLAGVEAEPGRVRLRWQVAEGANYAVSVQRTLASADWATLGRVVADGTRQIVYEDRDVVPGARYGYRLALADGHQQEFGGEVWVEVPSLALAIRVERNPVDRSLEISFILPNAEPATLQLVDLGGRRVLSRAWNSPTVGEQRVVLEEATRLPSGVYLVKLSQGHRSALAKASVVR